MKEIMKHLEAITAKGHRPQQVFDDWVRLMTYALMRDDKQYLEVMKRYRNEGEKGKREADHFAAAFGLLMQEMAQTNDELLGEIYEAWEITNKYSGQYFTPRHVCDFIARVTGAPAAGQSVCDPCCGSGRMLIATCKITEAKALDTITFVGQDVDETCALMCALNFTFFNLNGYVYVGNSLGVTVRRAFQARRSSMGGSIREIDPPVVPAVKEQAEQSKPVRVTKHSLQQSLF